MYIARDLTNVLIEATKQFPVVFITGPRQSGKTTLLQHTFPDFRYVNLEEPELRQWAKEQPKDFLAHNHTPLIIDEVQRVPELFSYIQLIADNKNNTGMFLLSGSQNFLLMAQLSQTLAGRSAILNLLPFSLNEINFINTSQSTNEIIIRGFYPRLFDSVNNLSLFYQGYVSTYIERDVRQLANIGNFNDFTRFMKLCAGRCGQLLNISSLAQESGIAYNTCKTWLSYLSTGFIIRLLQPYHKNYNKRIIKSPKLYFLDTGLLSYLLGIKDIGTLAVHPFRGQIFENLVYVELLKQRLNKGEESNIYFWRDNHGTEVDFIIDNSLNINCIETKSGTNFQPAYLKNLQQFSKYVSEIQQQFLVYDGNVERNINNVKLLNWKHLAAIPES